MVPPFRVWAHIAPDRRMIGCNTGYIPTSAPPDEPAIPRTDGTWGPHDYTTIPQKYDPSAPYLAWCPSKSHPAQPFDLRRILDFTFTVDHFVKNPRAPTLGGLQKTIHKIFYGEVEAMVQMYEKAVEIAEAHSPTVEPPEQALQSMRHAIVYLNLHDIYCRDCQEGVETLRRNTREVLGFILWARTPASTPFPDVPFPVRGSVANDTSSYLYLCHRNVPAWLVVEHSGPLVQDPVPVTPLKDMCTLTAWRDVETLEVTYVDWEPTAQSDYMLKHSKPLWFYPPVVAHDEPFERAARGHAARQDVLNYDTGYQRRLRALQSRPIIIDPLPWC